MLFIELILFKKIHFKGHFEKVSGYKYHKKYFK